MLQTLNTASANVDNTAFYVWDPLMNVRGAYVTVQLDYLLNSSDNSNLDSAANEFFQPGQAVFLKTTTVCQTFFISDFERLFKGFSLSAIGVKPTLGTIYKTQVWNGNYLKGSFSKLRLFFEFISTNV